MNKQELSKEAKNKPDGYTVLGAVSWEPEFYADIDENAEDGDYLREQLCCTSCGAHTGCIDCYNEQQEKENQCKCNKHSFVEIVNTSYSFNGVPYPEYTGEFVCENCGISKKDVELQGVG